MYNQPFDPSDEKFLIKDSDTFLNYIRDPDTVSVFTTEFSRVGESTFAEIFVNCYPEKTTRV
jgi:hypothetical protein